MTKQDEIRCFVSLNEQTINAQNTDILYLGETKLRRTRIAKRISRIRKGITQIDGWMFN